MATIANVAPDELIESAWGNSIANELNGNTVKRAGAQSMAGPLTVSGTATVASLTTTGAGNVAVGGSVVAPSGNVGAGNTPSDVAAGALLRNDGIISGTVNDPTPLTTPSLTLQRTGVSAGVGGLYVSFRRLAGSTQIGSISIVTGPAVAYNTSSDRRLKDIIGDVGDAVARLLRLKPRRLRWKLEPDADDFDGFIADEVQAVIPGAVTGEPDAVLPDDDEFDPGGIDPQQLDVSRLIPLLVAAVQELAGRVDQLETR
jgi:Chaperone of endosialidase